MPTKSPSFLCTNPTTAGITPDTLAGVETYVYIYVRTQDSLPNSIMERGVSEQAQGTKKIT